jgi:hypothetical protein
VLSYTNKDNQAFLCGCVVVNAEQKSYQVKCTPLWQDTILRLHVSAKHGHRRPSETSPTYISWLSMQRRCNYPGDAYYGDYGGRGISVCERWGNFESFLKDMGERPAGHTLDRIDVDKAYSPENCRWATPKDQARNRRSNHMLDTPAGRMCILPKQPKPMV